MLEEKFDKLSVPKKGWTQHPIYNALEKLEVGYKLIIDWEEDIVKYAKKYPNVYKNVLSADINSHGRRDYIANVCQWLKVKKLGKYSYRQVDGNTFEIYRIAS